MRDTMRNSVRMHASNAMLAPARTWASAILQAQVGDLVRIVGGGRASEIRVRAPRRPRDRNSARMSSMRSPRTAGRWRRAATTGASATGSAKAAEQRRRPHRAAQRIEQARQSAPMAHDGWRSWRARRRLRRAARRSARNRCRARPADAAETRSRRHRERSRCRPPAWRTGIGRLRPGASRAPRCRRRRPSRCRRSAPHRAWDSA